MIRECLNLLSVKGLPKEFNYFEFGFVYDCDKKKKRVRPATVRLNGSALLVDD